VPQVAAPPAPPPEISGIREPANPPAPSAVQRTGDPIQAFRDEVSRLKQPLLAYLEHAEELRFGERGLEIVSPPGDGWVEGKLRRGNNWQVLEQAAAAVWGPGTALRMVEGSGTRKEPPAEVASVKLEMVAENPTIQTVLEIFQGRVEKVEEHSGGLRED
jgi:hypothetical protein